MPHPKPGRPARPRASTKSQRRQRLYQELNPRWIRGQGRTGRIPRTLIDASTPARAAEGLRTFAAAIGTWYPCYAQTAMRYAEQIANSYTEAQAVANMTATPTANAAFTEGTFAEGLVAERVFSENTPVEPEV